MVARPDLFEVLDASLGASGHSGTSVQDDARIAASTRKDTGGIYLQLGAFSAYDNADNFLARMRSPTSLNRHPWHRCTKMAYSRFMPDLIPITT